MEESVSLLNVCLKNQINCNFGLSSHGNSNRGLTALPSLICQFGTDGGLYLTVLDAKLFSVTYTMLFMKKT